MRLGIIILAGLMVGGCARELPRYQWIDHATALETLSARAQNIETISARCDLTLSQPNGRSITLDAAVVSHMPDHLRLRAWKFGQAVFDLTLTPQGLWIMQSKEMPADRAIPMNINAEQIAQSWALLGGGFFNEDGLSVEDHGGSSFKIKRTLEDGGQTIICEVDRRTLTPRRYTLRDDQGKVRFVLEPERYRRFGDIFYPTKFTARSEAGQFIARLHEIEINSTLPPNVFQPPRRAKFYPPRRAEKLP